MAAVRAQLEALVEAADALVAHGQHGVYGDSRERLQLRLNALRAAAAHRWLAAPPSGPEMSRSGS